MYVHPVTKEAVYSVTTVIENGIPKPGLVKWAAKEAARFATKNFGEWINLSQDDAIELISTAHERTKGEAADKGDEVHTSTENYLNGTPDGKSLNHMRQLEDFLAVSGYKKLFTEVTVWNRTHEYAGTADLIAETPSGKLCLIDYKSGKSVWPEAFLQLEALARAEFILQENGTEITMPPIQLVGVLHLRPKSWWFHLNADMGAADRNWDGFLGAKMVADWRRLHPSLVFGPLERMNAANWRNDIAA